MSVASHYDRLPPLSEDVNTRFSQLEPMIRCNRRFQLISKDKCLSPRRNKHPDYCKHEITKDALFELLAQAYEKLREGAFVQNSWSLAQQEGAQKVTYTFCLSKNSSANEPRLQLFRSKEHTTPYGEGSFDPFLERALFYESPYRIQIRQLWQQTHEKTLPEKLLFLNKLLKPPKALENDTIIKHLLLMMAEPDNAQNYFAALIDEIHVLLLQPKDFRDSQRPYTAQWDDIWWMH